MWVLGVATLARGARMAGLSTLFGARRGAVALVRAARVGGTGGRGSKR